VIYDIPPSCPVYNVTYVYVYDFNSDVVYTGYTSGYTCSYVYGGTVVYGTGWYYRPWYRYYYYPRPVTWGFGVHYNPYSGWNFSFGIRVGGPYGWFRVGWGRPYAYWGPRGYWGGYRRGYRHGYHHGARRGYAAGYRAGQKHSASRNIYRNRADGVNRTGEVRTAQKSPAGKAGTRDRRDARSGDGIDNVYVDRDGDVYRDRNGKWEKQAGTGEPRSGSRSELDNYREARERGKTTGSARQSDSRDKSAGKRDTREKSTGQRNTRQGSTSRRDTRQKSGGQRSTRPTDSGQRNTRSSGSRRTTRQSGRRR
jgi:hypothetical protein